MSWLENITDELIALMIVGGTLIMITLKYELPEFWQTGFGVVIGYYFSRKVSKS